jgi:hypothetical protein
MLDLDLMLLRNPERFQHMCTRLARYEYPTTKPVAYSTHDGGRDAIALLGVDPVEMVVFQCKFVAQPSKAKRQVLESLDALDQRETGCPIVHWILCLPVDPTGVFIDWLAIQTEKRQRSHEIWGRTELLARLERHPDVIDAFFYGVYSELSQYFRSTRLELFKMALDGESEWRQPDEKVLGFASANRISPDLVFDVIIRNRGSIATAITAIEAEVFDWDWKPHGLPGDGLLFPQVEYRVSIHGGQPGTYRTDCETPLAVAPGGLVRFKIRVTETGYAWNGALRLTLVAGPDERLVLPAMRIWT